MRKTWIVGGGVLLCAVAAAAQVKVSLRADGTKVMLNEDQGQRQRRLSSRLVPLPESGLGERIDRHARRAGLDPRLVQAVVQVESGYNARALSSKGAMGLMQLMPETARRVGVANPYDVDENLLGGTTYLRQLVDRFGGQLTLALAGYNAGPEAVERHGGVPPYRETRDYVSRVLGMVDGADAALGGELRGRKVYVVRDARQRILITTSPAAGAGSQR
jgi:soluble lytic murein transglycosylase-like protein